MNIRLKLDKLKINIHNIFLFLCLSLNINAFYLVNSEKLNLKDINLILILIWFFLVILSIGFKVNKKVFINALLFIGGCFILAITSTMQSRELYGQRFLLGFRAQRLWIIYPIIYFILHSLLKCKKISFKQIIQTIYFYCLIELVIGFVQFLIYDYVDFTYVLTNDRYGKKRFYFDDIFLNFTIIYSVYLYMKGINKRFNFIYIILVILFHVIVMKGRMAFVTLLFTLFIMLFFFTKMKLNRKMVFVILGLTIFVGVLFTSMGKDILYTVLGINVNQTSSIRELGRKFYLETIHDHPILGGGYINTLWQPAYIGAKMDEGILIVDNGVFGFMFEYGLLGMFFLLCYYIFITKKAIYMYKKDKNSFYITYIIFSILGMYTLMKMGTIASLELPIFMTLICFSYDQTRRKQYA